MTKDFLSRIGIGGVSICIMTVIAFLIGYNGWFTAAEMGGSALLGTRWLWYSVCQQTFPWINCKSDKPVVFTKKLWNNKYLVGAFFLGMILITCAIAIPALDSVFK